MSLYRNVRARLAACELAAVAVASRLVVGLVFLFAAFAVWRDPAALTAETWVPDLAMASRPAAVMLGALGIGLVVGWRPGAMALAAGLAIDLLLLLHLRSDRLFDASTHLLPWLGGVIAVLVLRGGDRSAATLVARLFLGMIFVAQGWYGCFVAGPLAFAERVYVVPFAHSPLPAAALWVAGALSPPTQLLTGAALIAGFGTRRAAIVILGFLVTIVFGHLLDTPLVPGPDLHDYALANFALAAVIAQLAARGDRFALRLQRAGRATALAALLALPACVRPAPPVSPEAAAAPHLAAARAHIANRLEDVDEAWAAQREYALASQACPRCAAPLAEAAEALVDGPIIFSGPGHRLSAADGYAQATALAERALALAPDDPRAWHVLAIKALYLDYDWCRAAEALHRELRDGSRIRGRVLRAYLWTITGKVAEAEADLAGRPEVAARNALGVIALFTGRFAVAAERFEAVLRDEPNLAISHFWHGNTLVQLGRAGEAIDELRGVVAAMHGNPGAIASLAQALAAAGRGDDARAAIAGLEARRASEVVVDYQIAAAWAMLGNTARALELLTRAVQIERDNWPTWLGGDPRFHSLRGDPAFETLVQAMHFGPLECHGRASSTPVASSSAFRKAVAVAGRPLADPSAWTRQSSRDASSG